MSACPGSGKSTWARRYCSEHPGTRVVSSDDVRYELTGQYQDFSKQKEVWETVEKRLIDYGKIENITVILDACVDLNSLRIKYADLSNDYEKKILVVLVKPLDQVLINNRKRNPVKFVPEDILIKMYSKFEAPSEEAISHYDEFVYIDKYFK